MGGGTYSQSNSQVRSKSYMSKSTNEIFSHHLNPEMNPFKVELRESRDSVEHPESFPIIIGLDVTGSMGSIPEYLVKGGFNHIMGNIIELGLKDPQVLFMGVGDDRCDEAPFQLGQFESSDELLDKWLSGIWLESGGGGNGGESYFLPWYFASKSVQTDHFSKRGKKGILITIGDEPVHKTFSDDSISRIFSAGSPIPVFQMIENAKKMFEIYHLNILTSTGKEQKVQDGWKELLGDNFINISDKTEVPNKITELIYSVYKSQLSSVKIKNEVKPTIVGDTKPIVEGSNISDINML